MTRLIVWVQSVVCSVENTRCPVSAAFSAVSSVSISRISPIRMTSGAWRNTCRSAALNDSVSFPTSRCEMFARLSRCRNSIGSSMVMMLTRRPRLMWLIIAASAAAFPDPVTPVRSTSPRGLIAISSSTGGRFRSWIVFTSYGIDRNANATVPRCWYTLVRNRPTPGTPMAKSASLCSANSLTWRGVMICSASDFSSSGLSGCVSRATSSPLTRIVAGRPTLSSRSEPLRWTMCVIACLKLNAAPCGASAMGIDSEEGLSEFHGLGVLHEHLPDHPWDLGLDLVHDLHRFNDAHHLPGGHPRADFHVGLRARLGGGVERPHHRGLDLEQGHPRGGAAPLPPPACCLCRRAGRRARQGDNRPLRHYHVLPTGVRRMPRPGDADGRPRPEPPPPHLDRAELRRVLEDLHQTRDDVEVHCTIQYPGKPPYTSSARSVRPSVSSTGPSLERCTSSSIRTPPSPARYTPGSIVTTACAGGGSALVFDSRGASCTSSPSPCPRECPKASPNPPASISSRASASASRPVMPARTPSRARSCAPRTSSYCARCRSLARPPTTTVRVTSAQ